MPLYYEDFHLGQTFTTMGRTITEFDVVQFAAMTGDNSSAHTDEEYSRKSIYGQRLVHGPLTLSYALGLVNRTLIFEGTGLAYLGMDQVRFHAPVFIADTITVKLTITSMRTTKNPERGILVRRMDIFNQRNELVLDFHMTGMVLRRGAEGAGS